MPPSSAGPSLPPCPKYVCTQIHCHTFGSDNPTNWLYCNDGRCWTSRDSSDRDIEYLCLRSDGPALSFVAFTPGSVLNASSLSPVVAHYGNSANRPAYFVYRQIASRLALGIVPEGSILPVPGLHEDDDNPAGSIATYHLLIFDWPSDSTHQTEDLSLWIWAHEIHGSDVLVISPDWERGVYDYELNFCDQW